MSQFEPKKPARKPRHPSVRAERIMEMCERRMTSLDNIRSITLSRLFASVLLLDSLDVSLSTLHYE